MKEILYPWELSIVETIIACDDNMAIIVMFKSWKGLVTLAWP